MAQRAAEGKYEDLHRDRPYHDGSFPKHPLMWRKERSAAAPFHYNDGTTIWMSETDLTPDDDFLSGPAPLTPPSPESPGQE